MSSPLRSALGAAAAAAAPPHARGDAAPRANAKRALGGEDVDGRGRRQRRRRRRAIEFARQAEAFAEADGVGMGMVKGEASEGAADPVVVTSREDAESGRRSFAAWRWSDFCEAYLEASPGTRHVYEIVREARPCRLYLDVEFEVAAEEAGGRRVEDGPRLLSRMLLHVARELRDAVGELVGVADFLVLDSSTPAKFSRHVVLHLPSGRLFENNAACGRVVISAVARAVAAGDADAAEIVDTKVYTRNRAFRMLWSRKFGKSVVLDVAPENEFGPVDEDSDEGACRLLGDALVCPLGAVGEVASSALVHLPSSYVSASAAAAAEVKGFTAHAQPRTHANARRGGATDDENDSSNVAGVADDAAAPGTRECFDPSPNPLLDAFIRNLASANAGPPADIRSWSVRGSSIRYAIARNRFCARIGREHRSNHVFFLVDAASTDAAFARQLCTDPDCRGFASPGVRVPFPVRLREMVVPPP